MLDIGAIGKPHGLAGEVRVHPLTNVPERRFVPGAAFDADGRTLVVATAQADPKGWLVFFEGVESREDAEALRGVVLRAEPLDDPDTWWAHDLVGSRVELAATGAQVGTVTGLEDNPAHDLLLLDTGALVPVVFVTEFDREAKRVVIDPPAGLLDLGSE